MKVVKWLGVILLIFIVIAACSGGNNEISQEVKVEEKVVEEVVKEATIEEEQEIDIVLMHHLIMELFTESFEDVANVTYDEAEDAYILIPTDPDFIQALLLVNDKNAEALIAWKELVSNFIYLSETMYEFLPDTVLALANPVNTDNVVLVVWNGIVLYDYFTE